MSHSRLIARLMLPIALAVAGLASPPGLDAQLAVNRSNTPVLVMDPIPADPADTAYALALADAIRDRMESRYRFELRVIPTETICEAKQASGFECQYIFAATNAPPLARFLQAQGYMVPWLRRGTDSVRVRLRMVNALGSGLGGWATFSAPADATAERFGRRIADELDHYVEAAEKARECDERRSQSDFDDARERAEEAFEIQPDHPAAAECLALLFEVTGQPPDSIAMALERAVRGDSINASLWEQLGRARLAQGDTTAAIEAFLKQLEHEPGNIQLMTALAGQLITMGQYQRAESVIAPAIEFNPRDLTLLALRERACYQGKMWPCALEMQEQLLQIDSTLRSNPEYLFKVFSGAQEWEASETDSAVRDSVIVPLLLTWSNRLVELDSTNLDAWRARSQALQAAGRPMDAVRAFRRILQLDSTQVSAAFAAAQILWDSTLLVIDSMVPLDTARVLLGDSLWQRVVVLAPDTATRTAVAVQYYQVGNRLVTQRMNLPLASRLLRQAIALDLTGVLRAPANFFLGLSGFFQMFAMDQRLRAEQRCALVEPFIEHVNETRAALLAGRSVAQATVDNQLMPAVQQVISQFPAYRANFCR